MTKPDEGKTAKKKIKQAIEEARPATAAPSATSNVVPFQPFGRYFRQDEAGIWKPAADESKNAIWICAPLTVEAETRTHEALGWGLLVRFEDRDGNNKELVIPRRLLAGDGAAVRELLADAGLALGTSLPARQALVELLGQARSPARATSVPRNGWHRIGGRLIFALPDNAVGSRDERIFIEADLETPHAFHQQGVLEDWKRDVASLCIGNSRLGFAVSCSFAAPLLELLGADGGGANFKGRSKAGKTTALKAAASVWGGEVGPGSAAYVRTWRVTSNALENVAMAYSGALLALDEMDEFGDAEIGPAAYMLASGRGKARANRAGGARAEARWTTLLLSTGEVGLQEKMQAANKITRTGQTVRIVDIPADAGAGCGMFEDLHGAADLADFAKRIVMGTTHQFGTAARPWLEWLAAQLAEDEGGFKALLRQRRDELARQLLPPGAEGQVTSVANFFALVGLAGELASEADILPWPESEAEDAAARCFQAWLAERGTVGAREDHQAEEALRTFIQVHGAARFQIWGHTPEEAKDDVDARPDRPPHERFRTVNRAGFKRWEHDAIRKRWRWVHYLTASAMAEALTGLNFRDATTSLLKAGYLMGGADGKSSRSLTPAGEPKQRLYVIADALLSDDDEGDP